MHTVYGTDAQQYDFGPGHPFSPMRQQLVIDLLRETAALPELQEPEIATENDILSVHSQSFVECVKEASCGRLPPTGQNFGLGTADVPVFKGMDAATRRVVGGTLLAARLAQPGQPALHIGGGLHHAQRSLASGFCVYNDVAIAIQDLLKRGYRMAYLDIDAHHGNGVQDIFYEEPRVLTISLHESGRFIYPGTGFVDELGNGSGYGSSLNVPLWPATGHDSYLEVFDMVVPPALSRFRGDALIVECGADAHAADPLAHLRLTSHTFEALFRRIRSLAAEYCQDRLILHLGGGYDMDATVRVWSMLALLMLRQDIPERLPDSWVTRWERKLGIQFSSTWHDTVSPKVSATASIKNRSEAQALLDLL